MITLKTNMLNELEVPSIILSTKYHKHLGIIQNIDTETINVDGNMATAQELSFDVYKEVDSQKCELWDSIVDLKYIYVPQYNEYYEIYVSLDEYDKTIKHITSKSACEAELGQRLLRDFECNTETDILNDDYIITKFYNPDNVKGSLLHRVLNDKCQDYSIGHVDETLWNIQRSFSVDGTSIYDFLTGELSEEIGCLFIFDSVKRSISVYDLKDTCNDCGNRGEFNTCSKCDSTNITHGTYGENTNVYISNENFAESITIEGDADSVKTCFRIEGGDDEITAALININPSASPYTYCFPDSIKKDMPEELSQKIDSYNELYEEKLSGYEELTEKWYDKQDELDYLQHTMMPTQTLEETTSQEQLVITTEALLNQSIAVQNINTLSLTSANLAVKGMANVIVDARYEVEIVSNSSTLSEIKTDSSREWSGKIRVVNDGDDDDYAESEDSFTVKIIGNNYEEYLYQKIQKSLDKEDSVFYSIFEISDIDDFKAELTKYCLSRLSSFEESYETCINVLIENGVTTQNQEFYGVNLFELMYEPYMERINAIQEEIALRELEIDSVQSEIDSLNSERKSIQELLNFQNYLGEDLWLIFCSYLREDTYTNSNYIHDGLTNSELIQKAKELFEVAKAEIQNACELQITLNSTLQNLVSTKEFADFKNKIKIGNWITVKVDDTLYHLRLINIGIDYSDLSKIKVTFSNAIKIKDIISDTKSILSQSQSMATSYSYVEHQAEQGNDANNIVDDWSTNGALLTIKNNNNEELEITKNGLLARSWDDVLNNYSPEQLKITHNCLAYTTDYWNTVSAALGKLRYKIDDVEYEDYGLNADHVIAGTIVGGNIYSTNYSSVEGNKSGTHLNLYDGTFTFAGEKLVYKDNKLSVYGDIYAEKLTANEIYANEEFSVYRTEFYSGESYLMFKISTRYTEKTETGIGTEIRTGTGAIFFEDNIYAPNIGEGGSTVEVDDELSTTSENPVQNKVVTQALTSIATSVTSGIVIMTQEEFDAIEDKTSLGVVGIVQGLSFEIVKLIDASRYREMTALIPAMTSNECEVGMSSCPLSSPLYNGQNSSTTDYSYYAFDGDESTWLEYFGENQSGGYCEFTFNEKKTILKMTAKLGHYQTSNYFDYYLQCYDYDSELWVDMGSGTHTGEVSTVTHEGNGIYTDKIRFYTTSTKRISTNIYLYELQAYGY